VVGVRVCATSVWDVLNQATVAVLIKVSFLDIDARVPLGQGGGNRGTSLIRKRLPPYRGTSLIRPPPPPRTTVGP